MDTTDLTVSGTSPGPLAVPAAGPSRRIRSYKQRRGRIGPARAAAISRLLPRYGLDASGPVLDLGAVFDGRPVVLEIGCGHGEATVAAAGGAPGVGILAVDVHLPGLATLLQAVEAAGLDNLRVVHGDAVALLERRIATGSLAGVRLLFPDPWPKARHRKRRLLNGDTAELLADRCAAGATLELATDDADYAAGAVEVLDATTVWRPIDVATEARAALQPRTATRFEAAARAAGRQVHEVIYRRAGR